MGKIKTAVYSTSLMMMMMMMMMITETSASSSKNEVADMFPTAAPSNLNGKMFTLSSNGGRQAAVSFYPPYFSFHKNKVWAGPTRVYPHGAYRYWAYPTSAYRSWDGPTRPYRPWAYWTRASRSWPDPTRAYPTRAYSTAAYPTTAYPSWTTEAPTKGVTVCLRYLLDTQISSRDIFTLSPTSRGSLTLSSSYDGSDLLVLSSVYWSMRLKANVRMWAGVRDDLWTRLCLTVDTVRGVVQVFSGAYMSIRKMTPSKYVWSGEPVIAMSGVDGQVTDVQIWDYPLSYNAIFNYMTPHNYGWPRGSVLTWSDIRYTATGRVLLEDVYEQRQAAKTRKKKKAARKSKKE